MNGVRLGCEEQVYRDERWERARYRGASVTLVAAARYFYMSEYWVLIDRTPMPCSLAVVEGGRLKTMTATLTPAGAFSPSVYSYLF